MAPRRCTSLWHRVQRLVIHLWQAYAHGTYSRLHARSRGRALSTNSTQAATNHKARSTTNHEARSATKHEARSATKHEARSATNHEARSATNHSSSISNKTLQQHWTLSSTSGGSNSAGGLDIRQATRVGCLQAGCEHTAFRDLRTLHNMLKPVPLYLGRSVLLQLYSLKVVVEG